MKKGFIVPVLSGFAVAFSLAGCSSSGPHVLLETTKGPIVLELDRDHAPISVENFLSYVDEGAYDGTLFHRVIPGFVVQGGGRNADMVELPSKAPIRLEWPNGLLNARGTIGMARETEPDTATREWFINLSDNERLDTAREVSGGAGYAVFGRVISGMEVVDAIAAQPTREIPELDMKDVPVEPIELVRATRTRKP